MDAIVLLRLLLAVMGSRFALAPPLPAAAFLDGVAVEAAVV
jgi:hypothetical protein